MAWQYTSDKDSLRVLPSVESKPGTRGKWVRPSNYTSPLYTSFASTGPGYSAHSYEYINPYKVVEVNHGSWRSFYGGVNPRVLLWAETKEWEFAYENKYESAYAKLEQQGLLSKVSQLAEGMRAAAQIFGSGAGGVAHGGRFMSKYKEAPAWTGSSPLQIPSSIKFNFKFGQAGLFSGLEEVVKPIICLAVLFAPFQNAASGFGNYFVGPMPTAPSYFATYLGKVASLGMSAVSEFFGGGSGDDELCTCSASSGGDDSDDSSSSGGTDSTGDGLCDTCKKPITAKSEEEKQSAITTGITKLTELEQKIRNVMDEAIAETAGKRFMTLTIGKLNIPQLVVKNVAWKFDMTHTDEYGFPWSGSITFSGLENMEIVSQGTIRNTISFS